MRFVRFPLNNQICTHDGLARLSVERGTPQSTIPRGRQRNMTEAHRSGVWSRVFGVVRNRPRKLRLRRAVLGSLVSLCLLSAWNESLCGTVSFSTVSPSSNAYAVGDVNSCAITI